MGALMRKISEIANKIKPWEMDSSTESKQGREKRRIRRKKRHRSRIERGREGGENLLRVFFDERKENGGGRECMIGAV